MGITLEASFDKLVGYYTEVHSYKTLIKGHPIVYEWKPHYCWPHVGQSNEF